MSTIKFSILSLFVFALSLTSFSTYANTLPVDAEIFPVEIEQVESTLGWGPVQLFVFPSSTSGVAAGTPVRAFARANNPDGTLQELAIMVNGQPITSSGSSRISGSFTPTAPGTYVIFARAIYQGFHMVASTPVTITVQ